MDLLTRELHFHFCKQKLGEGDIFVRFFTMLTKNVAMKCAQLKKSESIDVTNILEYFNSLIAHTVNLMKFFSKYQINSVLNIL